MLLAWVFHGTTCLSVINYVGCYQLKELSLGYGSELAVSKIDANINSGTLTAIIGPNGAGKSTPVKGIAEF